mmetsp:Transcript_20195/g.77321  ORF Transcript_20195/g.77321 Transcript_20195/m.77321 type:complete len:917 (-) Transcript_20195:22-2772(-)
MEGPRGCADDEWEREKRARKLRKQQEEQERVEEMMQRRKKWRSPASMRADVKCLFYSSGEEDVRAGGGLDWKEESNLNSMGRFALCQSGPELLACCNTTPRTAGKVVLSDKNLHCSIVTAGAKTLVCGEIAQGKRWTTVEWASAGKAGEARLLAAAEGRVFLFSVSSETAFARAGSAAIVQLARYKHAAPVAAVAVPRIEEGVATAQMATVDGSKAYLWDLEHSKQPVVAMPVGECAAVAYSGQGPQSLLLASGAGSLTLVDCREGKRRTGGWSHRWQGLRGSCAVSVSPFIPHWAAVAAQGSALVYDLRFGGHGPVRELRMHSNGVVAAAWSPRHAELIATASLDGTARLWDLTAPPLHCISTSLFGNGLPLTGVAYQRGSSDHAERLFFGSMSGTLASADVTDNFLHANLRSRCAEPIERAGSAVEKLLYSRRLKEGLQAAIDLSKTHQSRCPGAVLELLQACTPADFLAVDPEAGLQPEEMFEAEILRYSYLLPPDYPLPPDMPPALLQSYLTARQELRWRCLIQAEDHEELASQTRPMARALAKNADAVQPDTVAAALGLLLEHNAAAALPFAEKLAAAYEQQKRPGLLREVAISLLSPTIYDLPKKEERADALEAALASSVKCLEQITLLGRLLQRRELLHKTLLAEPTTCLSAGWQMERLEELLEANFFAEVLLTANKLVMKTKGMPFSVTLVRFIGEKVEKRLAAELIGLCTSKAAAEERPEDALRRHAAGVALIGQFKAERMSQCVPQRVHMLITQGLSALTKAIPAAFARLEAEGGGEGATQKAREKAAKRLAKAMEAYAPATVQGSFRELFLQLVREVERQQGGRVKGSHREGGHREGGHRERSKSPRERQKSSKSPRERSKSPRERGKGSRSRSRSPLPPHEGEGKKESKSPKRTRSSKKELPEQ